MIQALWELGRKTIGGIAGENTSTSKKPETLVIHRAGQVMQPRRINTHNITGLHKGIWGDFKRVRGDVSKIRGMVTPALQGDVSNIIGDISNVIGDVSKLQGDISKALEKIATRKGRY